MISEDKLMTGLIRWNLWGSYSKQLFPRSEYITKITASFNTENILVLIGVRRSGKSSLTYLLADNLIKEGKNKKEDFLFVNCEDPEFITLNLEDLTVIYELYLRKVNPQKNHYVILDEIHKIKGWEKFARMLSETKNIKVIATGSNSELLTEEYTTVLSGRYLSIVVYPLSFNEFILFNNLEIKKDLDIDLKKNELMNLFDIYLQEGGFPKYVLTKDHNLLSNYLDTILIKDIINRYNIRKSEKLNNFSQYLLSNISTKVSYTNIADLLDSSQDTIGRYARYFQDNFLFYFINKFSFSKKKQIKSNTKVYSIDVGLNNFVGFMSKENKGGFLENIVFIQLLRKYSFANIFYWQNYNDKECDFVIYDALRKIKEVYQVGYDLSNIKTKTREITGLILAMKQFNLSEGYLISYNYSETIISEYENKNYKIKIIPVWRWLLEENK